jgi:hypothetical protein
MPALILSFLLLSATAASADGVEDADRLSRHTDGLVTEGRTEELFFSLTPAGWKKEETGLRVAPERAAVSLFEGRVVKAVFMVETQSGDWALTRTYYFFEDGETALLADELITFQGYNTDEDRLLPPGPYTLRRKVYFGREGKKMRTDEEAFVTKSGEALRPEHLNRIDPEVYTNARALPFFFLVEERVRGQ